MFQFDPKKFSIRYEYVSSITTAVGGSIRILNKEKYEQEDIMESTRIDLPYAVARTFQKRNNNRSTFLIPVKMAIVSYDGVIVQVEKAKYNKTTEEWYATSEQAAQLILEKVKTGYWCTDGQIIYKVPSHAFDLNYNHTYLSINKRFLAVSVDSIKFSDMHDLRLLELTHTRTIVGFVTNDQDIVYCPPIWKNVMEMRSKGTSGVKTPKDKDKDNVEHPTQEQTLRFDLLNDEFFVNLEFILSAGQRIGSLFGFDKIEFLQLHRYVVDTCMINLPKIDRSQRSTYNTGLQFMSCFAWLCGFINQCETVEDYNKLRSVFKMLSMGGIFSKSQVDKSLNIAPPELKTREEAKESVRATTDSLAFSAHIMNRIGTGTNAKDFNVQQFITGLSD